MTTRALINALRASGYSGHNRVIAQTNLNLAARAITGNQVIDQLTLPPNVLGEGGTLQLLAIFKGTATSTNVASAQLVQGANTGVIASSQSTSTAGHAQVQGSILNLGQNNGAACIQSSNGAVNTALSPLLALDFTKPMQLQMIVNLATTSDILTLLGYVVDVFNP